MHAFCHIPLKKLLHDVLTRCRVKFIHDQRAIVRLITEFWGNDRMMLAGGTWEHVAVCVHIVTNWGDGNDFGHIIGSGRSLQRESRRLSREKSGKVTSYVFPQQMQNLYIL